MVTLKLQSRVASLIFEAMQCFYSKQIIVVMRHILIRSAVSFLWLCMLIPAKAQLTAFKKSRIDTAKVNDLMGTGFFAVTFNRSENSHLFFQTDLNLLVPTRQHVFDMALSSYFNGLEKFASDNRLYVMFRQNYRRHKVYGDSLKANRLHIETSQFFQYDEARGLLHRFQLGTNVVYIPAFTQTNSHVFLNASLGVVYEWDYWRLIDRKFLPDLDSLPDDILQELEQLLGIDNKGNVPRNNFRLNASANFIADLSNKMSVNLYANLQLPFQKPFRGLPQLLVYPDVNKNYLRSTVEALWRYKISHALSVSLRFYLQHDKAQITPNTPDVVYTISPGLSVAF